MKFLIISGNPKKDGLCNKIIEIAAQGVRDGGGEVEILSLSGIERCKVCGDGWGSCRSWHKCAFGNDGFTKAQESVKAADKLIVITPVYWAEMNETLKSFFDRLRRCEFGQGALCKKETLLVASPGGSGNGAIECMDQMDRFCRHTGATIFDYVSVNRWNNDYKSKAVYSAAKAMAEGRKAGETLVEK
ncbi:MAG: flavodoxin family protein [Clostridiales bacterium]|jgi:multimeric flavodoxin WrbA|nr:flavodoxin family protein [Clostridiales bacterium]